MQVKIEKYDELGRGIAYLNGKVLFVPKTVPGDVVEVNTILDKKNYSEGQVVKFITYSDKRINIICPYFNDCGGCDLLNISYEASIQYKTAKIINIFNKNGIVVNPEIIVNPQNLYYRNKISLKFQDGKLGYFKTNSHELVEINSCLIANKAINKILPYLKQFNISNGNITIRTNQNEEILLIIDSYDNLNININEIKKENKLIGIIINNRLFYGIDFLTETINDLNYRISYDSFFQVNPFIASKLFKIVEENINEGDIVLDIYCGVGTLSLSAAKKAQKVLGIEIVKNAVANAKFNAKVNNLHNVDFLLCNASDINLINNSFNKIIVDPPRSGLTKEVINTIFKINPSEIIYTSCDPQTLIRDIKILSEKYSIEQLYILDMFSYSYHVECVCLLKLR